MEGDEKDDLVELDNHALQLASRGFVVILPFYLDAQREQTEPSKARAAHRTWRRVALDAADAVAAEVGIATGNVILWGHGRGGGIALAAALQPESPVGGAVAVNIGGSPQDDAQGAGRPFLLFHSARSRLIPALGVRTMADRIQQREGRVRRIEIDAEADRLTVSHWCAVMDGTRSVLDQTQAARSVAVAGN